MTQANREVGLPTTRETLKYRLLGQEQSIGDWGHEYVRHLAMEIIEEASSRTEAAFSDDDPILNLAIEVATFFLDHNGEPDACDLLYEIGKLSLLPDLVMKEGRDHSRVCLYLIGCVPYEADGDDRAVLEIAHRIYRLANDFPNAMVVAMRLNSMEMIKADFVECQDPLVMKQLAYMLARQRICLDEREIIGGSEEIKNILWNTFLTDHYRALAKELEIIEPKSPDDIFKSHLQDALRVPVVPSPRTNLATSFVSAFVNAGFGTDTLLTSAEVEADETKSWIYKTKDHGIISTVASIGLLHLWNADTGLGKLDQYLYSENVNIRAGAILGIGLVHAGTKSEADPALALLREYLEATSSPTSSTAVSTSPPAFASGPTAEPGHQGPEGGSGTAQEKKININNTSTIKGAALIGLSLAYGGTHRHDVSEAILPFLGHSDINVASLAALALGHVFVGSCEGDIASAILQTLMEREAEELNKPMARFLALALALLYLGKTEAEAEVILDTLQVIEHPIARDAATLVKICSYVGSGNVLKIQELLRVCTEGAAPSSKEKASKEAEEKTSEAKESGNNNADANADADANANDNNTNSNGNTNADDDDKNYQSFAVIGIALICMMEEIGKEMSHRLFTHLMHYGSPGVRKAVPLALGLLYASHPSLNVMDLLSKYSHDHDKAVAVNATFAMGLVAAGTNNAKMAQMLRQLAAYYQRDADCLYVVRLAQGLVHAGKGTLTFSPIHSHRLLISPVAVAGLLTTLVAFTDAQSLLLEHSSYLLYFVLSGVYPRFAVTLDAQTLQSVPVTMRVGQAVDVVGQAGKPKSITGFQTHTSPVLLSSLDRAEFATEEYLSLTPILESFILVRKNPDWIDESNPKKK